MLHPWPALTTGALLARRPAVAGAAFAASSLLLARRLRDRGVPADGMTRAMAGGVIQTWLGLGRWCAQFAGPAVVAALVRPGGRTIRTRMERRAAAASLLLGPPLADWLRQRPTTPPLRYLATVLADQAAYGAGVWTGCARERNFTAVLPSVIWRPADRLLESREERRR